VKKDRYKILAMIHIDEGGKVKLCACVGEQGGEEKFTVCAPEEAETERWMNGEYRHEREKLMYRLPASYLREVTHILCALYRRREWAKYPEKEQREWAREVLTKVFEYACIIVHGEILRRCASDEEREEIRRLTGKEGLGWVVPGRVMMSKGYGVLCVHEDWEDLCDECSRRYEEESEIFTPFISLGDEFIADMAVVLTQSVEKLKKMREMPSPP